MGEIGGLYYEEHGAPDGRPLILSPGLGGSGAYWTPNLEALAEDYRVILYDHRGTGRSDRELPEAVTIEAMADDVLALADGLGIDRFGMIGHALGGCIGLALALKAPQRLARLVVINGFASPDPHFLRCMEIRLTLLHDSGIEAFVRAQPLFLYPAHWISEHFARLEAEEAGLVEHFQGAETIEARIGALAAFDISARLGEIRTPVLLLVAEDDMLVPDLCSARLAEGLVQSSREMMLGGHACNVTEPGVFHKIVGAWLAGARQQGAK